MADLCEVITIKRCVLLYYCIASTFHTSSRQAEVTLNYCYVKTAGNYVTTLTKLKG